MARRCLAWSVLVGCAMGSIASPVWAERPRLIVDDGPFSAFHGSAEDVARGVATSRSTADFGSARAISLASGRRVVKLRQMHDGVPVVARGATVTFDASGSARRLALAVERELPQVVVPTVPRDEAAITAEAIACAAVRPEELDLVVWPTAGRARLAWVAYEPMPLLRRAPVVAVDAHTGGVVAAYDAVVALNQAKVWPTNPVASPQVAPVTLAVGEGQTTLSSARLRAFGCIDLGGTVSLDGLMVHVCEPQQTAAPDAMGDYLLAAGKGTEVEDAFSEISVFYHVERGYAFFDQMSPGFSVQSVPLDVLTNLRLPAGLQSGDPDALGDASLPLEPFANAFFTPPDEEESLGLEPGGLFFGQGTIADFGYDGDVVYHELTHAVVEATIDLVMTAHADDQGLSAAPGAMNEALADYFSSAITSDPKVGEYAATEAEDVHIRDLTDADRCPDAVIGEPHEDATLFSGALWDVRSNLGSAEQPAFDLALFEAMVSAPTGDLGYEDLAKLFVDGVAASTLGKSVADALDARFAARGVLPGCRRVIEYPSKVQALYFGHGLGTANLGDADWAPGVVQFHVELGKDMPTLLVHFFGAATGWLEADTGTFSPRVLVRFGPEPIAFSYDPLRVPDDVLVVTPDSGGNEFVANVQVPPGATEAHVMIAQAGKLDVIYGQIQLGLGFSGGPGGDLMPPIRRARREEEGCTFRPAPAEHEHARHGTWMLALVVGAVASRRRRSRSPSC